jgi:hypothetical protein
MGYIFMMNCGVYFDEIQQISSVTKQKNGTVSFRFGKGPAEEEYIFLLRNGNDIGICKNSCSSREDQLFLFLFQ